MEDVQVGAVDDGLSPYKCNANTAICFKLVTTESDVLDSSKEFHPEFTHQYFGDSLGNSVIFTCEDINFSKKRNYSESIFGYKELQVQLYYHAGSLLTYMGMSFDSTVNGLFEGIEADAVLKTIAEKYPAACMSNLDDFIAKLPSESRFRPMGEMMHSYKRNDVDYEIYRVDAMVPKFEEYYNRLQTFVLWFIDAASYIEIDDEKWNFFLLFEKKRVCGELQYSVVGYMTVYDYYAYPDLTRPRVSQMLLLPPYRKQGHGAELLRIVEEYYIQNPRVLDITVEDPSEDFLRLRDYVDALACSKLECFAPDNLKKGFSDSMVREAQKARKMNKMQCRRVYEILRLKVTNRSNVKEYKEYRLEVKQRLNTPYQKEKADYAKLKKVLSSDELNATMCLQSTSERRNQLEQIYDEVESGYLRTIERIARA